MKKSKKLKKNQNKQIKQLFRKIEHFQFTSHSCIVLISSAALVQSAAYTFWNIIYKNYNSLYKKKTYNPLLITLYKKIQMQ